MFHFEKFGYQSCILIVLGSIDRTVHVNHLVLGYKIFDVVVVILYSEFFFLEIIAKGVRKLRRRSPLETSFILRLYIIQSEIKRWVGSSAVNMNIAVGIPDPL